MTEQPDRVLRQEDRAEGSELLADQHHHSDREPKGAQVVNTRSHRILLVDDDHDDFILTRALLHEAATNQPKGRHYHLDWASTYQEAWNRLPWSDYDAVLIDYDLGARTGLDLVTEAIRQDCSAPLIVLTGRGNYDIDLEAMRTGVDDYLVKKEVTAPLLERTLRYAMERKAARRALKTSHEQLAISNRELAEARDKLEARVQERTRMLANANEVLRQQEARLRSIIASVPVLFWATDSEGVITLMEGRGVEEMPSRFGSLVGRSVWDLFASRPDMLAGLRRAFAGDELVHTAPALTVEDEVFETHYSPHFNVHGELAGVTAVSINISERVRAEAERQAMAARSQALGQLSDDLAELGPDLRKVLDTIVHRVTGLLGDNCTLTLISADGMILEPAAYFHPDPDALKVLERIITTTQYRVGEGAAGRVAQTGQAICVNQQELAQISDQINPLYRAYLEVSPVYSILVVPLREQGKVIGTLGATRTQPGRPYTEADQNFLQEIADRASLAISNARLFDALQRELAERQRAEQAIAESEARFRTIFESSALGILLRAPGGEILACNPAFCQMLGYSEEEMFTLSEADYSDQPDSWIDQALFQMVTSGAHEHYSMEKVYRSKSGDPVWVRLAVTAVRNQQGDTQYVVELIENISERKQIESELEEVRRRLTASREAERLHLAQELHDGPMQDLYAVSYQLKNLEDDISRGEGLERLAGLEAMVMRIGKILRVIAVELRPPTLAPFGLQKTIQSHAETFQQEHPELQVSLDLHPDGKRLSEPVRLALFRIYQQSLANVVRHAQASQVSVRFHLDELYARLEIEDDGRGFIVPERWIDMVREGHLGLAGAAERAEDAGGRLEVASQPGKGTRLKVEVPLS